MTFPLWVMTMWSQLVTEIDNEDYTPIEKVANNIRQTLITDKKF